MVVITELSDGSSDDDDDMLPDLSLGAVSVAAAPKPAKTLEQEKTCSGASSDDTDDMPPLSPGAVPTDSASPSEVYAQVQRLRDDGGAHYKRGEVQAAIQCYASALELLQPHEWRWRTLAPCSRTVQEYRDLRSAQLALLTNSALCLLQGQADAPPDPARALAACERALELDPSNAKALFRRGKAFAELGKNTEAEASLARASEVAPEDIAICQELARVRAVLRSEEQAVGALDEMLDEAQHIREEGERFLARGDLQMTAQCNERGLQFLWGKREPPTVDDQVAIRDAASTKIEQELLALQVNMLADLVHCYIHGIEQKSEFRDVGVFELCALGLILDPKNVKVLVLRSQVLLAAGLVDEAHMDMARAAQLEPLDAGIRRRLEALRKKTGKEIVVPEPEQMPAIKDQVPCPPLPPGGQLLQEVQRLREEGGAHFKKGDVERAASRYESALEAMRPYDRRWRNASDAGDPKSELGELRAAQLAMLTNLALCRLTLPPRSAARLIMDDASTDPAAALRACESALELDPCHVKALFRKAKALSELARNSEAEAALAIAAKIEPKDAAIRKELGRLRSAVSEERLLAQVQGLRETGNDCLKQDDMSTAADKYEKGLKLLWGRQEPPSMEDQEKAGAVPPVGDVAVQLRAAHVALLTNLSLCYLKGNPSSGYPPEPQNAVGMCSLALALDPENVKALFRQGLGLRDSGQHSDAETVFLHAARLDPKDGAIRTELERVRMKLGKEKRSKKKEEKKMYSGMMDQLEGVFSPEVVRVPPWPEEPLPAPVKMLGAEVVEGFVENMVRSALSQQDGKKAYTAQLLNTLRHTVELQYGVGSGKRLPRLVPLVHRLLNGDMRQHYEPGKGQRLVASSVDGLDPGDPFHDIHAHPWCQELAACSGDILDELRQAEAALEELAWEAGELQGVPHREASKASQPPPWHTVPLVRDGVWAVGARFERTRALLREMEGLRPYEVCIVRVPPKSMCSLHRDSTNFLFTSLLGLDVQGSGTEMKVGDWTRGLKSGEALAFDDTFSHTLAHGSSSNAYMLMVIGFHADVSEAERYALLLLLKLLSASGKRQNFKFATTPMEPQVHLP